MKRMTTAAMIVLLAAGPAFAQAQSDNYPNRPIVWVGIISLIRELLIGQQGILAMLSK